MGIDPMKGYVNKYVPANPAIQQQLLKRKALNQKEEQKKKTYSIEFMLSLRAQNKERPPNMSLLDFPHKKKRKIRGPDMSEVDKFNYTVMQLR